MKIILILPNQDSIHSIFYEIYADLNFGIRSLGIESEIVEVDLGRKARYPFSKIDIISISHLSDFFKSNINYDTFFITVDDYTILKWLNKNNRIKNLLIWAIYFYGAKFIFKTYRHSNNFYSIPFAKNLKNLISGMIPSALALKVSGFYWKTLKKYPIFCQSVWVELLLKRVYGIPVLGTILIPINRDFYNFPIPYKREGILIFLGNAGETDLSSLYNVLRYADCNLFGKMDYFGNENAGKIFEQHYRIKLNFIGKVSRENLLRAYSQHYFTIAPIFDGNFEMVPIQSLLCGTPVISFPQPFLEVTGENSLIANIENIGEVKSKIKQWSVVNGDERRSIQTKILQKMESNIVAATLLNYIKNLDLH